MVTERRLLFSAWPLNCVGQGGDKVENHIVGNKDVVWQEDQKLRSP